GYEDQERDPDPRTPPPRAEEPEHDARSDDQAEEDPPEPARRLGHLEQLTDAHVDPLFLQVEGDRHRMDDEQTKHARDVDEHDPLVHARAEPTPSGGGERTVRAVPARPGCRAARSRA